MPSSASHTDPPPPPASPSASTESSLFSPTESDDEDAHALLSVSPDRIQSIPPPSTTVSSASPALITPAASTSSASSSGVTRQAGVLAASSSSQESRGVDSTSRGSLVGPSAPVEVEDDIEMEPITGHRRRRSSLVHPAGSQAGPSGRSRTPNSVGFSDDNGKISEETDADHYGRVDSGDESYSDEDLQDDEETGLTANGKSRRQRKRRRNTQLDQRIAREKNNITAEERKEADKDVVKKLLLNGLLILLWYLFSLSISIYNKWMFSEENLNFAFPLFTTSMHMVVQFILSGVVLYFVPSLRPNHGHTSDSDTSTMSKFFYITRIGPCGAATGLDIGLGNTSLKFISLTFYTMCKSSSLAFVLLFAFVFRLETPTWRLVGIIATMILGVILMVFGEVEFRLGGFLLVISAAFFSGFRWGLTQILLLRNPATSNPFSSIFFLTPVMFLVLIALAIPVEGFGNLIDGFKVLADSWGAVMAPLFLLFPGCLAFCMTASEFALLKRTSVVTLSIAGIFKEVVTITAATLIFHDSLTIINLIGLLTTMAAIAAYNFLKISKMRQNARDEVHERHIVEEDHFTIESRSSMSSDAGKEPDDGPGEATGLLRTDNDRDDVVVTSDGDFQPLLQTKADEDEPRDRRID